MCYRVQYRWDVIEWLRFNLLEHRFPTTEEKGQQLASSYTLTATYGNCFRVYERRQSLCWWFVDVIQSLADRSLEIESCITRDKSDQSVCAEKLVLINFQLQSRRRNKRYIRGYSSTTIIKLISWQMRYISVQILSLHLKCSIWKK